MSCPDPGLLQAHVEGFASAEEREQVRVHLEGCADCRQLVLVLAGEAPDPVLETTVPDDGRPGARGVEAGARIGRYVVLRKLGEGGMGVVYAAYDPELAREVAIKLIRRQPDGTAAQDRLLREGQALARVAHPNVVAVYDVGRHADQVFVAMELIDGETLSAWLGRARRSTAEVMERFLEAGRGLRAAHAAGLVHRDFKPNNVMLDRQGRVRVMDFGLARQAGLVESGVGGGSPSRLDQTLTHSNAFMGTPAYMAPEQLERSSADARTDQFAFCVSLYEALAGTRPFVAADLDGLRAAIVEARLEKPKRPLPRFILEALARGLRASPDERWPSMLALEAALSRDPSRRIRRAAGALAIVALLTGTALAYRHALEEESLVCAGAGRKLAGIWDDAQKQSLRDALKAQDPDDRARVEAALDRYAQLWSARRTASCEATRSGEQSQQALDLRTECLDHRLLELEAFVAALVKNPAALSRAVSGVYQLPSPLGCDDVAALRMIVAPTAPREVIEPLYKRRAQLVAQTYLLDPSVPTEAEALAEDARKAGAFDIVAGALYERAQAERNSERRSQAQATLRQGISAAAVAHNDTLLVVMLTSLAEEGASPEQLAESQQHLQYAAALIERLGRPPRLRWRLDLTRAALEWQQGKTEPAVQSMRLAMEGVERDPTAQPVDIGTLQAYFAGILQDSGRPDEAAERRKRAAGLFESALGPRSAPLLGLKMGAAIAAFDEDRTDEAIALDRQLVDAFARTGQKVSLGYALNNLGWDLIAGAPGESLKLLERARVTLSATLGPQAADVSDPLTGSGLALLQLGRNADARAPLEQALKLRDTPSQRESPERAETELALARALGGGPRALALARHGREVLAAHPKGARRKRLVAEADAWIAAHP